MFRSCDYCRHRKKKCVLLSSSTRCADCQHLDLPCEFSARQPSLKRRCTSQRLVARLKSDGVLGRQKLPGLDHVHSPETASPRETSTASEEITEKVSAESSEEPSVFSQNDTVRRTHSDNGTGFVAMDRKQLIPFDNGDAGSAQLYALDVYSRHLHPFLPFVPWDMFDHDGSSPGTPIDSAILDRCIRLACQVSIDTMRTQVSSPDLGPDTKELESQLAALGDPLPPRAAAGVLLLIPCVQLCDETVQRIYDAVDSFFSSEQRLNTSSQLPLWAGAMVTNVWRRLVGHEHPLLSSSFSSPECNLRAFAESSLDPSGFAHHAIRLAHIAVDFDRCRSEFEHQQEQQQALTSPSSTEKQRVAWARLEYECLLWQVTLPPTLLDLRDDLPATPSSVVLHALSCLVLISFYSYLLVDQPQLGALVALRPVPGVVFFMCALARSVFVCPAEVLDRWVLLREIQVVTARRMRQLWEVTGLDNCHAVLSLWHPSEADPEASELARSIRAEVRCDPRNVDEIDGYSVFWTFRDLRTLLLESIVQGRDGHK